ncbi:hypothetical protein [Streptomyces sp. NPDC088762]|uniref:hypothetical protein n=1 Tax=Streptomyces sp. NPDC088762 TaxID=3365891 RepID=UPI00381722BE
MSILNAQTSRKDASTAAGPLAGLLPLTAVLPALTAMFGDRFGDVGWAALVVAELVLIATTGALAARAGARR